MPVCVFKKGAHEKKEFTVKFMIGAQMKIMISYERLVIKHLIASSRCFAFTFRILCIVHVCVIPLVVAEEIRHPK